MAELQAYFRLRFPSKTSRMYYPYNTGGKTLKRNIRGRIGPLSGSLWASLGRH